MADSILIRKADKCTALGHTFANGGESSVHTKCSDCGQTLSSTHTYGDPTYTYSSDHSQVSGSASCSCGYKLTETVDGTYRRNSGPTCTEGTKYDYTYTWSYPIFTTTACPDYHYEDDKLGHDWDYTRVTTTTAPTCTASGTESVPCSRCTETYTYKVNKLPHNTAKNGGTANCHKQCSMCGTTTQDGSYHAYEGGDVSWYSNHSSGAYRTMLCECGYSYIDDSTSCSMTNYTAGTCTTEEQWDYTATFSNGTTARCPDWHRGSKNPSNHTGPIINGGASDCHQRCDACGGIVQDGTYHDYAEDSGEVCVAATCTLPGSNYKRCACGYNPRSNSHLWTTSKNPLNHTGPIINGGTSDCHQKCDACGGITQGSSYHNYIIKSDILASSATCQSAAKYYYRCVCGYNPHSADKTYTSGSVGDHVWDNPGAVPVDQCITTCQLCGTTCSHNSAQDTGYVYYNSVGHDIIRTCPDCGYSSTHFTLWPQNLNYIGYTYKHTVTRWTSDNSSSHTGTCYTCNSSVTQDHTWGTATNYSSSYHKYTCTASGCNGSKYENHYLNSSSATSCATCGRAKGTSVWQIILN